MIHSYFLRHVIITSNYTSPQVFSQGTGQGVRLLVTDNGLHPKEAYGTALAGLRELTSGVLQILSFEA